MKLFLDSANLNEIREANDMGIICGVTTNPSLIAKEGNGVIVEDRLCEIATMVNGPISAEVDPNHTSAHDMIEDAKKIAKIHPNMVIKIPMTEQGLIACRKLTQLGIKVNMTLIFSANQALLAALAGAAYVSPFVGRLDDIDVAGVNLIGTISRIFKNYYFSTEIIAASIRNPIHVTECALAGADIATVPFKVIQQMVNHPLTDVGIDKFKNDYEKVFGK